MLRRENIYMSGFQGIELHFSGKKAEVENKCIWVFFFILAFNFQEI